MPIAFVLDENLRGKPLWHAIRHHNLGGALRIDATRVGDPADLPLGSLDPDILAWAERADRIIITEDAATFPAELAAHLRRGQPRRASSSSGPVPRSCRFFSGSSWSWRTISPTSGSTR